MSNGGNSVPLYCVHTISGAVTSYYPLAGLLAADQRVYGIQVPTANLHSMFSTSIEAMAAYYVDVLTSFQPDGPLILSGFSAGAAIALEMAKQLQVCGRELRLLVIFDGVLFNGRWSPVYYGKLVRNLPLWRRNGSTARDGFTDYATTSERCMKRKFLSARKRAATLLKGKPISFNDIADAVDTTKWPDAQMSFARGLYKALKTYVPKEFEDDMVVYLTKQKALHELSLSETIWEGIAHRAEIVYVDGDHVSMMQQPSVHYLADDLRERLHEVGGK
jgi:thioesterase domain-containing protein